MWKVNPQLKDAIANDKLIIFAGAGISSNFNLPNWNDLIVQIINHLEELNLNQSDEGLSCFVTLMKKKWLVPLQILNMLQKKYEVEIIEFVRKKLKIVGNHDFSLHRKIIELSEKIITTNYDKAFERASEGVLDAFTHNSKFNIGQLQKRTGFIFKIHGDVDELDNSIFFENQYKNLYNKSHEHPAVRELTTIFIGKTILFIGFSLNDPYIEEIYNGIFEQYKFLGKHYLITNDINFEKSKHAEYIVPILVNDYSEVSVILDEMIKIKTEAKKELVPKTIRRSNLLSKQFYSLVGREEIIESVLKKLNGDLSVITIEGFSGVGKTSLAMEVGYACLGNTINKYNNAILFDYVVWISSNDNRTSSRWLNTVFDSIARVMGNDKIAGLPEDKLEAKKDQIEYLITNSDKKLLIIIDEFEAINDKELLDWVSSKLPLFTKVIITTTKNLPIKQANVPLRGLESEKAFQLIHLYIENAGGIGFDITSFNQPFKDLVEVTEGNPKALELALGSIRHGKLDLKNVKQELDTNLGDIFENLHLRSWSNIRESSKTILSLFPQFIGSHSVSKDALYKTSPLSIEDIDYALLELLNWNLLSFDILRQRYTIHPITYRFVKPKLDIYEKERFKKRWSVYYLDFVRNNVLRDKPKKIYWNALVSDKMNMIKEEWTAILEVMQWSVDNKQDKLLIDLVMLLVHYMDSRFYNQERIKFVDQAIGACNRNGMKYEEALLRIDALGWTHVEESSFESALNEIKTGLDLLSDILYTNEDINNLKALAFAWQSRIKLEQGYVQDALKLLQKANDFEVEPWIKTRIKMVKGDIEMQQEFFIDALESYLDAEKLTISEYGLEGHNYQINPRLGLAYLQNGKLEEANKRFRDLEKDDHIAIGKFYGKYGLALITYEKGKNLLDKKLQQDAIDMIVSIDRELGCHTKSNLLQNLIKRFLGKSLNAFPKNTLN